MANIVDLSGDGGVTKEILAEGEGEVPAQGFEIEAHYVGTLEENGEQFDSSRDRGKPFKFTLGQGQVIKAWDLAFATMKRGEKAVITAKAAYAYGEAGSPPKIPGGATLKFEVELLDFHEKEKELWEMSADEKLSKGREAKEAGNERAKAGDWAGALHKYESSLRFLEELASEWAKDEMSEEEAKEHDGLYVAVLSNASLCANKLSDWAVGRDHAKKALEWLDSHKSDDADVWQQSLSKALVRRATALAGLQDFEDAEADLNRAREEGHPSAVKGVDAIAARIKKEKRALRQKEKKAFGGMFVDGKVSLYDDKEGIVDPYSGPLPRVYFDIAFDDEPQGRIEMQLFEGVAPKTVANFKALCTGEKGTGTKGKPLHFKNSVFHRIIPEFMAQGGDFTNADGTGGESIYGETFKDETFAIKHDKPYLLSMANSGPNTNGSQFFITFKETPWLDNKHVVFGEVIQGFDVVDKMEKEGSSEGETSKKVTITDCGLIE